ncbi:MAG: tetratricopeptide repeat protein [Lachnospiraceae bacterium]|nr:tetratricopeptide repeat protein [Lachnospiraceae bacterium]
MSELILCTGRLSSNPYYIIGLGMNIYSLEELCYYLVKNAYIIDNDIMDEKLCDYIETELNLPELAETMKNMLARKVSLGEYVTTFLAEVGYLPEEELKQIKQVLVDNASLSFAEKRKKRADNLLNAKKFTRAIDEYQYVLQSVKKNEEPEIYASILHNIGVAYARLFIYDKAAYYFRESIEIKPEKEATIHYLQSLRMTMKRDNYDRFVLRMGYDDHIIREAEERMVAAQKSKPETEYSKALDEIKALKAEGRVSEYYSMVEKTFKTWKQEYRDQMIVRSSK